MRPRPFVKPERTPDEMLGSNDKVLHPWGEKGYDENWTPVKAEDIRDLRDPALVGAFVQKSARKGSGTCASEVADNLPGYTFEDYKHDASTTTESVDRYRSKMVEQALDGDRHALNVLREKFPACVNDVLRTLAHREHKAGTSTSIESVGASDEITQRDTRHYVGDADEPYAYPEVRSGGENPSYATDGDIAGLAHIPCPRDSAHGVHKWGKDMDRLCPGRSLVEGVSSEKEGEGSSKVDIQIINTRTCPSCGARNVVVAGFRCINCAS